MRKFSFLKIALAVIIVWILGFNEKANAQFLQNSEIGLLLGGSCYMGDLNDMKLLGTVSPAGGLLYRYTFNERWVFKASALYGTVKEAKDFNVERNLSFKSYIFEFSGQVEFNFLPYLTGYKALKWWSPYLFAGVGFFTFNPKAEYDGTWYNLQGLGTEGQGTMQYPDKKPYSLVQLTIPMGIGFKFSVAKYVSVGLEYGVRATFTDYLDDVSGTYADQDVLTATNGEISALLADRTREVPGFEGKINPEGSERGNSAMNDWYSFFGATVTLSLDCFSSNACKNEKRPKYYNDSRKRYPNL